MPPSAIPWEGMETSSASGTAAAAGSRRASAPAVCCIVGDTAGSVSLSPIPGTSSVPELPSKLLGD